MNLADILSAGLMVSLSRSKQPGSTMYSQSVFDFLGPLILLCCIRAGQKIQHLRGLRAGELHA